MKRADCYMTFTQALDQYLNARAELARLSPARDTNAYPAAEYNFNEAKDHLEALTGNEE